jgi:hypothetical protein
VPEKPEGNLKREVYWLLVKLLREGPDLIEVPGNLDDMHQPFSGFLINQTTVVAGPEEELRIYTPPPEGKEDNTNPPVIRRFVNQFGVDRQRRRSGESFTWPTVTVDYFLMPREEFEALDLVVKAFEREFNTAAVDEEGLSVWWSYGPEQRDLDSMTVATTPIRSREIQLIGSPRVLVGFYERNQQLASLNAAWQAIWDAMSAVCVPSRLIPHVDEEYDIDPHTYVRLLSQSLNDLSAGGATKQG